MRKLLPFCGFAVALAIAFSGCGGGGSSNPSSAAQATAITVHLSDPSTCSAPNGPFTAVWVTISDVLIHSSASAGPNDAGWIDLTPNLKNAPMQVNLLGIPDNQCFLATLGGKTEIQPGTYQQIRLILLDNSQASLISGTNHCGANVANCVVPNVGAPQPLLLSSQAQTGIKIPPGQIAGGQFTVPPGQTVDLDIDFNACASIIMQGNGQARLKPVLHAGEVALQTATSINGTIVDSSGHAISGGKVLVMLAQPGPPCAGDCVSNAAIEEIKMETTADASGNFIFCPVSAGMYDVIAIALNGATAYAATVTTGVQPGNTLGTVKLIPAGAQATIQGTVTTTTATNNGTAIAEDVTVVPMQAVTAGSANLLIPVPQFGASTVTTITTAVPNPPTHTCSSNTAACNDYAVLVPAGNPSVGVFDPMGTHYVQSGAPVDYIVDAQAALCSPSEEQTNIQANPPGGTLTVTAGQPVTAATLAFTGCHM